VGGRTLRLLVELLAGYKAGRELDGGLGEARGTGGKKGGWVSSAFERET